MNKKTTYLFYIFTVLISLTIVEIIYLDITHSISEKKILKKNDFVSLVGLTDLAISTEATYIRNRSVSDIFSIYKDDPTLREYFPSTYSISYSHIINPNKTEGTNEK